MKRRIGLAFFVLISFFLVSCSAQEKQKAEEELPAAAASIKSQNPIRSMAKDFSLESIKENPVNFQEFRGRESVLLLFWTTWCPYCRSELQMLNQRFEELAAADVRILAVNAGESLRTVKRYMRQFGPKYDVLLDADVRVSGAYRVNGVPSYILVDKQGRIAFQGNYFPQEYKQLLSK